MKPNSSNESAGPMCLATAETAARQRMADWSAFFTAGQSVVLTLVAGTA
jgi:hypothetical protein